MASPSVTYTFVNSTVADANQVNQNFADLIAGLTDGSKDLNINAITAAGTATFNGNTTIGNAAGDTATVNATATFVTTPLADTINENTSTNGVQIKGRTSGSAIAAGYIGEIYDVSGTSNTINAAVNLTSKAFTKGVWWISLSVYGDTLSGTPAASDIVTAVFTTGSTPTSTGTLNDNKMRFPTSTAGGAGGSWSYIINIGSDTTYYLHGVFATGASSGTIYGRIRAQRIG